MEFGEKLTKVVKTNKKKVF